VEANALLEDHPELLNSDPYGEGWMIKIRASDPAELEDLMDSAAYSEHIG
jgi:glycine cleavage system H protein